MVITKKGNEQEEIHNLRMDIRELEIDNALLRGQIMTFKEFVMVKEGD